MLPHRIMPLRTLLLALALGALAATASAAPEESFASSGSARFYPWTSLSYCGEAEQLADLSAQARCGSGRAMRLTDYAENIGFRSGGGIAICTATAQYRCQ